MGQPFNALDPTDKQRMKIPFNIPYVSGKELSSISAAVRRRVLSGEQSGILDCEKLLEGLYGFQRVLLTNSCTMALEMAALLVDIGPGDEVILPSFTYVSSANAFSLRGAVLRFADSNDKDPNISVQEIKKLINQRTKVILVVHYAGLSCDMDAIMELANKHGIMVVEDAAHCIHSFHRHQAIGKRGALACFSFHETKNIHCGEGGMLVVNDVRFLERAEIVRNKGTNRDAFNKKMVSHYEWVDLGFSSLPNAMSTAFLQAQLRQVQVIQKKRKELWNRYQQKLADLSSAGYFEIMHPSADDDHNAHLYYLVCRSREERDKLIDFLGKVEIQAVFHFQTLHDSIYFISKHDRRELPNAKRYSDCIVRLPLYVELKFSQVDFICSRIREFFKSTK